MDNHQRRPLESAKIWMPLALSVVLVLGIIIGGRLQQIAPAVYIDRTDDYQSQVWKQGTIEELIRYVEAKYVDSTDRQALTAAAINSILNDLDPHSSFIPAEELAEVNDQLEGNFDGIGVEFLMLDDTIVVVAPMAGGPSEAAGILAGDKIVQIEDSIIVGHNLKAEDIINMLRGEKGTEVKIGVLRAGEKRIRKFTVKRDKIPVHSVEVAYMLNKNTGYIKIIRFSANTYEEFMKGLEALSAKGLKNIVLDLRYNPGGYLQQATNMLSQFFKEKDKLLVYTQGRTVSRTDYKTTGRPLYDIDNLVVLIDEGSASASEIIAGAIQDHDRGLIVGRRSFGKGLVQEQYRLSDGSALRLTVARYYTPSGRSIQKPYKGNAEYEEDVFNRYQSGEIFSADKNVVKDSTKFYTSGGHVVFGGGGIMPDVFVPVDSTLMNDYYLELRQQVSGFVFNYMQQHEKSFKGYQLASFRNNFYTSDEIYRQFLKYAEAKGVKKRNKEGASIKKEIKLFIKARVARHLFGEEGFYTVWNDADNVVKKALELLGNPDPIAAVKK
ncbi:MAG: S41 family peptidase [Saprospiraceae bacterium]|nr:S41 family peptidase [Saprospiraceae bacterium]